MNGRTRRRALVASSLLSLLAVGYLHPASAPAAPTAAPAGQRQPQGALWSLATLATAGGILAACPVSGIRPLEEQSPIMRQILSATALLLTPAYAGVKAGVAGAGTIAGYWMLLLSFDPEEARATIDIAGNGDWRLRPAHMTCEEPIHLLASRPESSTGREAPMPP